MAITNGALTQVSRNGTMQLTPSFSYNSMPIVRYFPDATFESIRLSIDIYTFHTEPYLIVGAKTIVALAVTESGDPQQLPPSPGDPTFAVPPDTYLRYEQLTGMANMGGLTWIVAQEEVQSFALTPQGGLQWNVVVPRILHDTQWAYYLVVGCSSPVEADYQDFDIRASWTYLERSVPE